MRRCGNISTGTPAGTARDFGAAPRGRRGRGAQRDRWGPSFLMRDSRMVGLRPQPGRWGSNFRSWRSGVLTSSAAPSTTRSRTMPEAGALMFYGLPLSELFRLCAAVLDRILQGVKLGDLPGEQPTTCELVVNLKTAKLLGIPPVCGASGGGGDPVKTAHRPFARSTPHRTCTSAAGCAPPYRTSIPSRLSIGRCRAAAGSVPAERGLLLKWRAGERTHNGTNHPIGHWQAMEGAWHRLGCRGTVTNVVRTV